MSLSNPRQASPAKKFIDWSGSKGLFYYYDKETKENVYFEKEIYIIPIDELSTIKGFNDHSQSSIYSNEVKSLSKENLIVKSFKGGSIITGKYEDIKGKLEGGKFAKSIYAVLITGNKEKQDLELVNISFHGAALGSFIDARINCDSGEVVGLNLSTESLKKGNTVYFAPVIKKYSKREDILAKCIQLDMELQEYLKTYFAKPQSEIEVHSDSDASINTPEYSTEDNATDDLPF